jgi:hypothetical protein
VNDLDQFLNQKSFIFLYLNLGVEITMLSMFISSIAFCEWQIEKYKPLFSFNCWPNQHTPLTWDKSTKNRQFPKWIIRLCTKTVSALCGRRRRRDSRESTSRVDLIGSLNKTKPIADESHVNLFNQKQFSSSGLK